LPCQAKKQEFLPALMLAVSIIIAQRGLSTYIIYHIVPALSRGKKKKQGDKSLHNNVRR